MRLGDNNPATMNRIFVWRFLPFLLLLFEIANFCASVSPDELNVPYVPYVVVDKNKDEFDYERLQDTIVKYLENRSQRGTYVETPADASTSLYDFLRTSTSVTSTTRQPPQLQQRPADTRSINVHPYEVFNVQSSYQTSGGFRPSPRIRDKSLVTANVKVTTYQPHRYQTARTFAPQYPNVSSVAYPYSNVYSQKIEPVTPRFVPLKESLASQVTPGGTVPKREEDFASLFKKFPFGGEMKCSLRSSRYVYDGDCVSKKPVVETVCADRCIKYEYSKPKKPIFTEGLKTEKFTKSSQVKRPVVALTCKDGDVKKEKIKLYCKDGTIINNVIRIVNNCICQEHSEKVHATKRSHRPPRVHSRKRMLRRPMMRPRERF